MIIETKTLRNALELLERNISSDDYRKGPNSVLFNGTTISNSNDYVEVAVNCDFIELFPRQVLIPHKPLFDIVRNCQDETMKIKVSDEKALIEFGKTKAVIPIFDTKEYTRFPVLSHPTFDADHEGIKDIIPALKAVRIGISHEETRWYLNGVHFSTDQEGNPCVVATDGHKLAWHKIGFMPPKAESKILHKDGVKFLCGLKKDLKGVKFEDGYARFLLDGVTVTVKLIDGFFPDWKKLTKPDSEPRFTVKRGHLEQAIARIKAVVPSSPGISTAVHTIPSPGVLALHMGIDECAAETAIPAETAADNEKLFNCAFNGEYLMQISRSFTRSEKLTFSSVGPNEPFLIAGDGDNGDLKVIVMFMMGAPNRKIFDV